MRNKLLLKKALANIMFRLRPLRGGDAEDHVRVLMYHSITDTLIENEWAQMTTPRRLFAAQMQFLRENGYNVISCDEAVYNLRQGKKNPPKAVCITFDDGFKDNLTNGLPVLEKYGCKATIFLTADYVGKSGEYLNWDEVRSLSNTGLVTFGAHSLSHGRLSGLGPEDLERELVLSKKVLEQNLAATIDLFAYPFGSYGSFDPNVERLLRSTGYAAAFTTIAGPNTPRTELFRLRRTRISWYDDEGEFEKELKGAYDWYRVWQMMDRAA